MRGAAKRKVVTSGRLTGGVKEQPPRRQVTPNPGPPAHPEPAYSLYSTDSEDQVATLHEGLDRCAALLGGILRADKAASPRLLKAVTGGAAKSRPPPSLGKKTIKKPPRKTAPVQRNSQSGQRGAGCTTPRATHQFTAPAAHAGVTLHPPQRHPAAPLRAHLPPPLTSILPSEPQSSPRPPLRQTDGLSASEGPHTHCKAARDREGEEEDFVPVRDIDTQSTAADTHTAVTRIYTCTADMSNMHLEPGQVAEIPQGTHSGENCSAETEVKAKTVQYLLGELKALIAGQGSVAERLLSHLEQTVSSPLMNVGISNIQTERVPDLSPLHNQNIELRRHVRILKQQLKEKEEAEEQQNMETLHNSEVMTLQEELTAAQSRLQELQDDLAELRKALEDTRSRLRGREAENAVVETDLEAARSKLVDMEREKSELASLAQQRLEEIGNLKRILQDRDSSDSADAADGSVPGALRPAEPPTERITQYLMSLGQRDPPRAEHECVAAEREGSPLENQTSVHLRDTPSHADVGSQQGDAPAETPAPHHNSHSQQARCSGGVQSCGPRPLNSTLSQCDAESVWSDWSMRSGSTFDTRDEAAFRDGLAALDASIASLQKTIQLDLRGSH
ncbi:coiled-coil domain-containing protein 14 isoform X2 [Xiphias gladius]|uniref:coiled-coil domain-containing protein 14 isoform X2 n=1 Tax=Xiphias gladius TaxID=8245 RepID=UPI001A98D74F|nr:coiled-coil domain-containing protein 14 isoform X2 [Xiphias gladius]